MEFARTSLRWSHMITPEKVSQTFISPPSSLSCIPTWLTPLDLPTHPPTGFLDARSVRLPTVCVRTGAPSSAASSFISSLIREPLQGIPTTCPIASSVQDSMLDDMGIYVTRVKTVVWNIAFALGVKDEEVVSKVGKLRTINLPGIKINTRQILSAL